MTPLFVCTQGRLRSRTAELLCLFGGVYAKSAGTSPEADAPLSDSLIRQSSVIYCMEKKQKHLIKRFQHAGVCDIINLNIQDSYDRLNPELINILIMKVGIFDESLATAMQKGRDIIMTLDYQKRLGTSTERSSDLATSFLQNPDYSDLPKL